jgi:hypothetical protein
MLAAIAVAVLVVIPASAQDSGSDPFTDVRDGEKLHAASGFLCPARIGHFILDAVGEADPARGSDFCAYSALAGVYGNIRLTLLSEPYDAKTSLAPEFVEQEGAGAKRVDERMVALTARPGAPPLAVYTRTYETAKLDTLHYRVLFAGAQLRNWAVETTIEYADPRDLAVEAEFLRAIYAEAQKEIAKK